MMQQSLSSNGDVRASAQLGAAREAIDALDNDLLALIERRFDLSLRIAALKADDDGHLKIRPRREAEVLARLTARATTATPALIAHVWRELMAHSVQAQVVTPLVVHAPGLDLGDRIRERFGRAAPIVLANSAAEALDSARTTQAIAVMALDDSGWWAGLAGEIELTMFDSLRVGEKLAVLVGRIARQDIAPGCGLVVREQPMGEVLARSGALCLCRESGQ